MHKDPILREYDQHVDKFHDLGRTLSEELDGMLRQRGLMVHTLSYRVKPRHSLAGKLARPDKTYQSLWDLTDILGLRVVTYFEDTVEAVAHLVESLFQVDLGNSVDKRRRLGHDTFGYRSLHYVCFVDNDRLGDGMPTQQVRFELQVRTVLQHAWAEIEHDLGYKSQEVLPEGLRRRFSRLSGLLELADEEFLAIRRALHAYEGEVRKERGVAERSLDRVSLGVVTMEDEALAIDAYIAQFLQKPQVDDLFYPDYLLKMLLWVGLKDTSSVRRALHSHKGEVLRLVPRYLAFAQAQFQLQVDQVYRGYGLWFLAHAVLLATQELNLSKVERLTRFYQILDYPDDPRRAQQVASQLLSALS